MPVTFRTAHGEVVLVDVTVAELPVGAGAPAADLVVRQEGAGVVAAARDEDEGLDAKRPGSKVADRWHSVSVYAYSVLAKDLVREVRRAAGLSLRELARRSDLAVSTIHRVERGELQPTVETLTRITTASGRSLVLEARPDSAASVLGLGLAIGEDLRAGDPSMIVRRAAELTSRFDRADENERSEMLSAAPPPTGSAEWDAFLGGLAEWLAARAGQESPPWVQRPNRFLDHGWWVTPMRSLRAWEYAGTPVSLQRRGVYLHRESLVNR